MQRDLIAGSLLLSLPIPLLIRFNICSRKRSKKVEEARVFFLVLKVFCLLKMSHKGRTIIKCPVQWYHLHSLLLLFPAVPLYCMLLAFYSFPEFFGLLFFVWYAWSFQNVFSYLPRITAISCVTHCQNTWCLHLL